jgi:hypothetical protein
LNLQTDLLVSKFAFKLGQLVCRYATGSGKESLGKAGKAMSGVYAVVLASQVCDRVHMVGLSLPGGVRLVTWNMPAVINTIGVLTAK